jgi:hypothetical protein
MGMPVLEPRNQKQPLCYDPRRKKFIFFGEIATGAEKIIPVESLSEDEAKLLVIERQKTGPNYTMQSISGKPVTRDEMVEAIRKNEEIGNMTVEAEISMLKDLLLEIGKNLKH